MDLKPSSHDRTIAQHLIDEELVNERNCMVCSVIVMAAKAGVEVLPDTMTAFREIVSQSSLFAKAPR